MNAFHREESRGFAPETYTIITTHNGHRIASVFAPRRDELLPQLQ